MSVVTIYAFLNGVCKAAKVEEGGKTNDCYPTLPLYIRCNYYLWWYELFSPYTAVKIIFWIVWRREAKKTRSPWATSLTWENSSNQKYDYIITLIQRIKKKLYENLLDLHLNKLESPSPKDALCQDWLKLAQWIWRKIF